MVNKTPLQSGTRVALCPPLRSDAIRAIEGLRMASKFQLRSSRRSRARAPGFALSSSDPPRGSPQKLETGDRLGVVRSSRHGTISRRFAYASAADCRQVRTKHSRLRRTRLEAISISNPYLSSWNNFKKDLLGLQKLAQKARTRCPACLTDQVRDLAAICGNCRTLTWSELLGPHDAYPQFEQVSDAQYPRIPKPNWVFVKPGKTIAPHLDEFTPNSG